jgi:hypothetical protein
MSFLFRAKEHIENKQQKIAGGYHRLIEEYTCETGSLTAGERIELQGDLL